MISKTTKATVFQSNARQAGDTGSPEVQIALLTARIQDLSPHLKMHAKDHHGRKGLILIARRRRSLLDYLKAQDPSRYGALIAKLGIPK